MSSWQSRFFSLVLRNTFKRRLAVAADAARARKVLNSGIAAKPRSVRITPESLAGVPGEWVEATATPGNGITLLYLHGGGYIACSPRTHRAVTSLFARKGFHVFAPDYRLAPEHPFPAAVNDARAVYGALLDTGSSPARLVVAGDSAGGGLALALMLSLREHGMPLPAAAALFSPLTDLAGTGASLICNSRSCAMFHGERIAKGAELYLAGADPRTPLASPLYGDLRGLPPLLIHVGADEVLLDDSTRLAQRACDAGVQVELRIWPVVPHVWQLFHSFIPEGRQSLSEAADFLDRMAAAGLPSRQKSSML